MIPWICRTCGTQFEPSAEPPLSCPVCDDERQYVGVGGQEWTHRDEMYAEGYRSLVREEAPGLIGIGIQPVFAIGQRALLVCRPDGNILWDCVPFFDEKAAAQVALAGGIDTVCFSHPHFFSGMVDWAERFDAEILIPAADRKWAMRPHERINFWSGDTLDLGSGVTLLRLGGHFPGSSVLHVQEGADGKGALLTGDTIQVVADRNWVSFMYSYPNLIPLPAVEVERIVAAVRPYSFEAIYGGWFDRIVSSGADEVVQASAKRYVAALNGKLL